MSTPTPTELAYVQAARRGDQAEVARLEALIDAQQDADEHRLRATGALLNSALWYATSLNWPVFPCQPRGKRPATAHGFKDATTDPDQIRRWWRTNPDYNIGLPTGTKFDVIDIDGPEGLIAFGPFLDAGTFAPLATALTPRGRHYYIPTLGESNFASTHQLDYRGAGGYVVAPPSRTPEGTYRWARGKEPTA